MKSTKLRFSEKAPYAGVAESMHESVKALTLALSRRAREQSFEALLPGEKGLGCRRFAASRRVGISYLKSATPVCKVSVNAYERNPQARQKSINYYGASCFVCGFNFGKIFGELGEGLIHVHHLCPISEIAEEYEVDPIKDLRPVCRNCHAMIHRRSPPFSIEEIQAILRLIGDQCTI